MARVLVAEDDQLVRDMVVACLQTAGHEVVQAADGQQAWEMLQGNGVDLLITDFQMPRLDGLSLLTRVHPVFPALSAVIVSGTWTPGERQKARALGFARLRDKPLDLHLLLRDVEELVPAKP